MLLSTLRYARPDVDKYDVYSLISVLLALIAHLPPVRVEETPAPDENVTSSLPLSFLSADEEGETQI